MLLAINYYLSLFAVVAATLIGGSYVCTTDATYSKIYSTAVENLTVDENGYLYNPTASTITGYVLDSDNNRTYIVRWQAFSYSQVAVYNTSYSTTYSDYLLIYESGAIDVGAGGDNLTWLILLTICGGVIILCMRN